jgi:hypothetical protein
MLNFSQIKKYPPDWLKLFSYKLIYLLNLFIYFNNMILFFRLLFYFISDLDKSVKKY